MAIIVCQTCGDSGFKELLVCCSKCNITQEHRYCLSEIPTADDEEFTYICEQCVSLSNLSRQNNLGSVQRKCSTDAPPAVEALEKKETSFLAEVAVEAKGLDFAVPENFVNDGIPQLCDEDFSKKRRRLAHMGVELLYTVPIMQVESFTFANPEETTSQPIINPAWRGCFEIYREKIGRFVAHLSNKACLKVIEAAKLMPVVLSVKMMSRVEAWPKSFSASAPSDENVALYFFPGNESAVKSFDELVNQTMKQDLVLKALIHNVELLIFSSKQLPMPYWTYKGKYYFWGVFRGREESSNTGVEINKMIAETSLISHLGTSMGFSSDSRSSPALLHGPKNCL